MAKKKMSVETIRRRNKLIKQISRQNESVRKKENERRKVALAKKCQLENLKNHNNDSKKPLDNATMKVEANTEKVQIKSPLQKVSKPIISKSKKVISELIKKEFSEIKKPSTAVLLNSSNIIKGLPHLPSKLSKPVISNSKKMVVQCPQAIKQEVSDFIEPSITLLFNSVNKKNYTSLKQLQPKLSKEVASDLKSTLLQSPQSINQELSETEVPSITMLLNSISRVIHLMNVLHDKLVRLKYV